jgi:hypothetical protein
VWRSLCAEKEYKYEPVKLDSMFSKYSFWFKAAIAMQFITGILHSLSFLNKPVATNEREQQLLDLMGSYNLDMGAGFHPTMNDLMNSFSISFAVFLFFSGAINLYLLKSKLPPIFMKGIIGINLSANIICFIAMSMLTFLPPIVCTGLIVLCLFMAYLTVSKKNPYQ